METIDRYFRPGFWRLSVPLLIATILMVIATALVSTVLEEANPMAANAIGILFGGYVLAAAALYAVLILTRLRLHSDGYTLEASFMCLGFPVYRRSVDGRSWHAIARPGRPQMEVEGIGSYRVEVTTNEGGRIPFLGPILCWLFRIECL